MELPLYFKETFMLDKNTRLDILTTSSSEGRLRKLNDIRLQVTSDEYKIKEYLFFIAEELIFLNQERRKK